MELPLEQQIRSWIRDNVNRCFDTQTEENAHTCPEHLLRRNNGGFFLLSDFLGQPDDPVLRVDPDGTAWSKQQRLFNVKLTPRENWPALCRLNLFVDDECTQLLAARNRKTQAP